MDFGNRNYEDIFIRAKDSTVYSHAMVWIKAVMDDKSKTEHEKFWEIHKIVIQATNHVSEN